MKKKVLLFYITHKSGHHRASCAIESALGLLDGSIETLNVNFFEFTNSFLEKFVGHTYLSVIKNRPEVWQYLYDNPKFIDKTKPIKDFVNKINAKKLYKLIKSFDPDCICCTQAYPCGAVSRLKNEYKLDIPLVAVLTDFVAHRYWIYDNVDCYVVPSDGIKDELINQNIPIEKIKVFGIPIDSKFSIASNKSDVLNKFNLKPNLPVVLIMGGSQGLGPIEHAVRFLIEKNGNFQIVVVTGKNKKLFDCLSTYSVENMTVLGYVANMNELMDVSDIVITKPGGLTVSEALSKSLPMIIINPLPGQEMKNTECLVKYGAAVKCNNVEDIGNIVNDILTDTNKLSILKECASKIKKPQSAVDTAGFLLDKIKEFSKMKSLK